MLEWDVVYIIVNLTGDWRKAQLDQSSTLIRKSLGLAIETHAARLPAHYVERLRAFHNRYAAAILERNGLLHVHPSIGRAP